VWFERAGLENRHALMPERNSAASFNLSFEWQPQNGGQFYSAGHF
jgi:hypothetical protein